MHFLLITGCLVLSCCLAGAGQANQISEEVKQSAHETKEA